MELGNGGYKREKQWVGRGHGDVKVRDQSGVGRQKENTVLKTRQNVLASGSLGKDYLRYEGVKSNQGLNVLQCKHPLSYLLLAVFAPSTALK